MPSDWFNIPETGSGTGADPYRPEHIDDIAGIDGYAGQRLANSPRFTVRVFGTDVALNELANQQQVARIGDDKVQSRLMTATGQQRDRADWDQRFRIK